jgi:hypothetical protein
MDTLAEYTWAKAHWPAFAADADHAAAELVDDAGARTEPCPF